MLKNQLEFNTFLFKIFPNETEGKRIYDLTFQVTEDCNLKCSYCYQGHKTKNKMSFETAKKFIDYLFENKNNPNFLYNENNAAGFIIEFIGGEPFLEIDLIEQIVEYFELKFLEHPESPWFTMHAYNLSTNGTLYFNSKVQNFLNKYRNLVHVGVTIDGSKELHDSCRLFPDGSGSYDIAIQSALKELNQGYSSTKITLSPNNIDYLFDGIKNMLNLGFNFINANCCFEDMWDKESALKLFKELIKISDWIKENNLYDKIYLALLESERFRQIRKDDLNKNWCGVGEGGMIAIDPKGDYYPCIRFMPTSIGHELKPIKLGNVNHGFLFTEEEKENYKQLLKCTRSKLSNKECLECPIGGGCSWCLGYCYEYYGNLNQKTNFICEVYKMEALASKYLAKIMNDKKSYDLITLNYNMYKDLISENNFNKINNWEV